ncbi:unnamed protein product, partial [Rotaria socialis]
MGGRLTTAPSSSSTTAHQNPVNDSATNLSHVRA